LDGYCKEENPYADPAPSDPFHLRVFMRERFMGS
jgi:hypothetical protein